MALSWETQKALDEAEEASDRSRRSLFILLVISILVAMAVWNSRLTGWSVRRWEVAQERERQLHATQGASKLPDGVDQRQAASDADVQQKVIAERVRFVSVPVLGFGFDVNDLAIVGGVSFVLLLIWFHFSIGRERLNVDELFRRARSEGATALRDTYSLLSMTQVLSTPPHPNGHLGSSWGLLVPFLFWTPTVVQASVVIHDVMTEHRGLPLSVTWTDATKWMGIVCLGLMVKLTTDCWGYSARLRSLWHQTFREVHGTPQYFATHLQSHSGRPNLLANPAAGWSEPVVDVIKRIAAGTAAYYYVEPISGARLLLSVTQSGDELRGEIPGIARNLKLP